MMGKAKSKTSPAPQQKLNLRTTKRHDAVQNDARDKAKGIEHPAIHREDHGEPMVHAPARTEIKIHQEHLTANEKELRQFDLDYTYGPCVGMTRMERWERAYRLGLDPPDRIKQLLLDKKNSGDSLFVGQV